MPKHLMIVPSLVCPANCSYCFGPHTGGAPMQPNTIEAIIRWQHHLGDGENLEITFHGGEPLTAGIDFYRTAFPLLREGFASRSVRFAMQSNLWLLSEEFCRLFQQFGVSLGTSLDGPEAINDAQRGQGYFRRTLAGIQLARAHGMQVGCICTFTAQSAPRYLEIFDFFAQQGLGFSVHAALPPLGRPGDGWALAPEEHGQLLVNLLEHYLSKLDQVRISTLDVMCRSVSAGKGGICTFGNCLGEYLAVDPDGWIYSCQRFAGMPQFRLGNVHTQPSWDSLRASAAWQLFQNRQERIQDECGSCAHFDFCRGGCPYNALAAHSGQFAGTLRDPHCPANQRALTHITERAMAEVFSEANMQAVVEDGPSKHGLLRKGKLLQIMRGSPHPHEVAPQARKVAAAVALAASNSAEEAVDKLDRAGLVTRREIALQSVTALQSQLRQQSRGLVNAYLHVTYACNLACAHCYASSSPQQTGHMPVEEVVRLVSEASRAGFGKAVITGGEPLAHPQRVHLFEALAGLRPSIRPTQIVLRTNLAYPLTPVLPGQLLSAFDQIVVSVDGDEAAHDARRGRGAYAHTLANLHALLKDEEARKWDTRGSLATSSTIVIAAALTTAQACGPEGEAVRALGKELGLRVRIKPVLPLGRAASAQFISPEFYSSLDEDSSEVLAHHTHLTATCGLGMNLYIAPNGECFPCYALTGEQHALGNALAGGLEAVTGSEPFQALKRVTVDSNQKCGKCTLRYLCGGFCRAWRTTDDPDGPPMDCTTLHARACGLLASMLDTLEISKEQWLSAGLPLPEEPLRKFR